jgi:predicted lipoprotein with Yx(FWY)xxD motif
MTKRFSLRLFLAGLVLGAVGGAAMLVTAAYAAPARSAKGSLVSLRKTKLGTILVDSRGRTLYVFEKDKKGISACYGTCAAYWPASVSAAKPRAGKGVRVALLGTTARHDGRRQITYAGHPLYTFVGDKKPGQTSGEGLTNFGAGWDAIAANGHKIEPASSGGGSGGGYPGYPGYPG